jgi:hypothetical protein
MKKLNKMWAKKLNKNWNEFFFVGKQKIFWGDENVEQALAQS